jgi:hypothetical protein
LRGELLDFWARERGFTGAPAQSRLDEVTCAVRRDGELVGSSSSAAAPIPRLNGWTFWVHRSLLAAGLEAAWRPLLGASFVVLEAEPRGEGRPVGVCTFVESDDRRRHSDAAWDTPRMIHAGYLDDGRQLRIGYFTDQVSSLPIPGEVHLEPGLRLTELDASGVDHDRVIRFWTEVAGMDPAEAARRVGEARFVALDEAGELVAVSTAYLAVQPQLGARLWHVRGFVAPAYRRSHLGVALTAVSREHLEARYAAGDDRAAGFVMEVENPMLNRVFPKGIWYESDTWFVGVTERGGSVRVHWFAGARTPEP